jgi:hypothetical protein
MPFDVTYASTNGTHVPPYASWATAARYVEDALDTVASGAAATTWVGDGVYPLTAQILVDKQVTVRSLNGAAATVLRGPGSGNARVFQITHSGAVLDGLTVTNGYLPDGYFGGGIHMTGGRVVNCVISGNRAGPPGGGTGGGGGVYMVGGRLEACVVSGNRACGNSAWPSGRGGGVTALSGALVTNCVIVNNQVGDPSNYNDNSYGGGVFLDTGSTLSDSTVSSNRAISNHRFAGAGVYIADTASMAAHCRIVGNRCIPNAVSQQYQQGGGGVNLQGGTLRNCLVAGNTYEGAYSDLTGASRFGGGVRLDAGRMESCTVLRNYDINTVGGVYVTGTGAVTNAIVYFNSSTGMTNINTAAGVGYSCAPELTSGTGNVTGDPLFKDSGSGYGTTYVGGDYVLKGGSPALNAGLNLSWMTDAKDLAGEKRLRGIVDMGAFETPPPRGAVFVVR